MLQADLLSINLKHYGVGQETAQALAAALKASEAAGLRTLDLQGNTLKGHAAAMIIEVCRASVNVHATSLHQCYLVRSVACRL